MSYIHFFWCLFNQIRATSFYRHSTVTANIFIMNVSFCKNQIIVLWIASAKQFLMKNPIENKTIASRIYDLNLTTLVKSIKHNSKDGKWNDHNQILKFHELKTIHQLIKSLLQHDILSIYGVVFDVILYLKHVHDSANKNLIKRWFKKWWVSNELHKIKTKLFIIEWFNAAQKTNIKRWFHDYKTVLKTLNIQKNIISSILMKQTFDLNEWKMKKS